MKKGMLSFVFLMVFCHAKSQNKFGADISFGLLNSFSNDVIKNYETKPAYVKMGYFSRKKYDYPYFNILANATYRIGKKLKTGLQTGMYVHYRERYSTSQRITTLTVPLQITANYPLLKIRANTLGINAAAGILFFSLHEYVDKYKNSSLVNLGLFYKSKNGGLLKLAVEKQSDFVTVDLKALSQYVTEETFKYSVKRLAIAVSYGVVIK